MDVFNRIASAVQGRLQISPAHTPGIAPASTLSPETIEQTALFKRSPENYLRQKIIDTSNVFHINDRSGTTQLLNDVIKRGYFALVPDNNSQTVKLTYVCAATVDDEKKLIHAHWIPYRSGNVEPGYTDVAKYPPSAAADASAIFAFTPGMNGCSLEVRQHPDKNDYFRVFHNQHPGKEQQNRYIDALAGARVDAFQASDYFQHTQQSLMPVALNLMHHDNLSGHWTFISQPQAISPLDNTLGKMPFAHIVTRLLNT